MQAARRLTVALIILPLWALPQPARAGCCDSFWNCVGAVASAGVSCAADAAARAVLDEFLSETRRTRDDGKRQMDAQRLGGQRQIEEKLRSLQQERREAEQKAQRAVSDAAQAVRQARAHAEQAASVLARAPQARIEAAAQGAEVTPPEGRFDLPPDTLKPASKAKSHKKSSSLTKLGRQSGSKIEREGAAAGKREQQGSGTDPDRLLRAILRSEREIDDLMRQKQEAIRASRESDRRMQSAFDAGIRSAATLFESSFVVPLTGIIGQVAPLDPVAAGVLIAVLVNEIDQIKRKFQNEVLPAIREVDRSYQAEQAEADRQAGEARSAAEKMQELALAMKRAADDPDERNVQSLEQKSGGSSPFRFAGKKKSAGAAKRQKRPGVAVLPAGRAAKDSLLPGAGLRPQASLAAMASWQRVSSGLDRSLDLARQLQRESVGDASVANVQAFRVRADGHFESAFAGRDGPAIDTKEQELLREAARRFSTDAKLRKAAEALIREQAQLAKARLPREQVVSPLERPGSAIPPLEPAEGIVPAAPRKGGFHRR